MCSRLDVSEMQELIYFPQLFWVKNTDVSSVETAFLNPHLWGSLAEGILWRLTEILILLSS